MPYPTVVGVGTSASGTGDVTPGLPSGWAVGDIHILAVATANESASAPSGWNETASSPQGTGTAGATSATRITTFWRRAESGDTGPTVTDPGNHCAAVVLGLRGCRGSGDPWDVSSGRLESIPTSTGTYASVTTTVAECLIVYLSSFDYEVTGTENVSVVNAALSSITDRSVQAYADGNGSSLAVVTGQKATAGSIGSGTITWRSGLIPQSGLHGLITLSFPGETAGSGSASFNFTAAAGGLSDRTGSGSASFNFTAAAGGLSDRTGSGSASFNFTAAAGVPTSQATLTQTLESLAPDITAFDQTGRVSTYLDHAQLSAGGYATAITGTLSVTLDDIPDFAVMITGMQSSGKWGSCVSLLADIANTSVGAGFPIAGGQVDTLLQEIQGSLIGTRLLTIDGEVILGLEDITVENLAGKTGFGGVLASGGGTLEDLAGTITGDVQIEGSVTVALQNITLGGAGGDPVFYAYAVPGGVYPGQVGVSSKVFVWENVSTQWQSMCSNTLVPRTGNPYPKCVLCITPIDVP